MPAQQGQEVLAEEALPDDASGKLLSIIVPVGPGDLSYLGLQELVCNYATIAENLGGNLVQRTQWIFSLVAGFELDGSMKQALHDNSFHFMVLHGPAGRARQINLALGQAAAQYVWILHCDSRMDQKDLQLFLQKLTNPDRSFAAATLYYFNLKFYDGPLFTWFNGFFANVRSKLCKLPFGDQGFFASRKFFHQAGLFNEAVSSGEDHAFVWQVKKRGDKIAPLNLSVSTSARKYQNLGWLRTTANHLYLTVKQAKQFKNS